MLQNNTMALKLGKPVGLAAKRSGLVLVISMFIMTIIAVWSVSLFAFSNVNAQIASDQKKASNALSAAQSGLEIAKYIATKASEGLPKTAKNTVSASEADSTWAAFCQEVHDLAIDGKSVSATPTEFTDFRGSGTQIVIPSINFANSDIEFTVRFYRYNGTTAIKVQSIGTDHSTALSDDISRTVSMDLSITKGSKVLEYAIASKGRMWITGDSTINGSVFSDWNRPEISPFNLTSDSSINGTINTVLSLSDITEHGYQLETLDEYGNPIDQDGNTLGVNYDERYYSENDEIQGYHQNINYSQPGDDMAGMDISDYDTSSYKNELDDISTYLASGRQYEYFPHAEENYTVRKSYSSLHLNRYVYENQTFTNRRLPGGTNAVFKHCVFEGILYVDTYSYNTTEVGNNVRFDNCEFNGPIITSTPQNLEWMKNCLYFTGGATFQNTAMAEATILAPHFNVNLGNTNPVDGESNTLTGAVIGGIVDVRGNANITGTIISMCDTSQWSSGYVTNIGATLNDGGSETTSLGDIGTINITPNKDQMLPSGIKTPIVIKPNQGSYSETL